MLTILPRVALACTAVLTLAAPLPAGDIIIPAPFTWVRVSPFGKLVEVNAPFTRVRVGPEGPAPVVPVAPAEPGELLHPPRPAAPPSGETVMPSGPPVLTLQDFARAIPTTGGTFEVFFLHPHVRQPVKVTFSLPPGYPRRVRVGRDEIELDYGRFEVEIEFRRDGRVKVTYDD